MLFGSTSKPAILPMVQGLQQARSNSFKNLLEGAKKWKPSTTYDVDVAKRRDYFKGRQGDHIRTVLARHYPKTHEQMIPRVFPFFQHLVNGSATLYQMQPVRDVRINGKRDDDKTELMANIYRSALVDSNLQAADKIAAAVEVCFLRIAWDEFKKRVAINRYWPDSVYVVCNEQYPDQLDRATAIIAKTMSADGYQATKEKQRWDVWERVCDDSDPENKIDGWLNYQVVENGSDAKPPEIGAQNIYKWLPWVAVHFRDPDGRLFPQLETDDIDTADSINAQLSNRDHMINHQAHNQRWVSATFNDKAEKMLVGPDVINELPAGATAGMWQANTNIAATSKTIKEAIEQELSVRQVSPVAATADPKYMSDKAIRSINLEREKKRMERAPWARDMEERYLWPAIRATYEHYSGDAAAFGTNAELRVQHRAPAVSLDDESAHRVSRGRVRDNISTWPREMVAHGLAPSLETAEEMHKENVEYNKDYPIVDGTPFMHGQPVPANVEAAQMQASGKQVQTDDAGEEQQR